MALPNRNEYMLFDTGNFYVRPVTSLQLFYRYK